MRKYPKQEMPNGLLNTVYKRYWITESLGGELTIHRDGVRIASPRTLTEAKEIIDFLTA